MTRVWSMSDSQNADAVTYRLRQEAVLVAEAAAEQERLAGARRPVVEPRRLVGRLAVEAVVGVQLTVGERQVRRHGGHVRALTRACSCQPLHVTGDVIRPDARPKSKLSTATRQQRAALPR